MNIDTELDRQITELKIQGSYVPFVDDFVRAIDSKFHEKIHSIYMCGSIPKGCAVFNKSDADFTIVFSSSPSDNDFHAIEEIKKVLLTKYPFVIKIDTPNCTINEVLRQPFDWGFWIKIVSFCIHGEDLALKLPPMIPSVDLILGLNSDTNSVLDRITKRITSEQGSENFNRDWKKLARRLIRALSSLTVVKEKTWSDDLAVNKEMLIRNFPERTDLIRDLFRCHDNRSSDLGTFLSTVEKARCWLNTELTKIAKLTNKTD